MAKSKNSENEDSLTFMGQAVDPEIQKKVEGYMELDQTQQLAESDMPSSPKASKIDVKIHDDEKPVEPTSTAPLLPTEELPQMVKDEESTDNAEIETPEEVKEVVDEVNDEPEEKTQDEEPLETPVESEDVSEPSESDDQEEPVVESEAEPAISKKEKVIEPISDELAGEEAPLDSEIIDLQTDPDTIAAPGFEEEEIEIDKSKTVGELESVSTSGDPDLDRAVDDIVAEDADKLLEIDGGEKQAAESTEVASPVPAKKPKKSKRNFFRAWFSSPLYRKLTILAVIVILVLVAVLPTTRYLALNTFGVRVSASMKMIDDKTGLPLKNAELIIGDKSGKSDSDGNVKVEKVKLGKQQIVVKKLAFAEVKKTVTLGWGSNPLGEQRLVPTGAQFTFVTKDYVSDKPIESAEVSYGEASAKFNASGEALLTIPAGEQEEIEVSVKAENYREEKVNLNLSTKDKTNVVMVPSKKHVFVSKQAGSYDLYKVDVDGKNEEVILKATGIEKEESLSLSSHPKKPVVAFASTRENTRNQDGFLLTTLNLVYLDNNEVVKVTQSERIQIVDWSGDNLIYVKVTQGASQANTNRHKIMSYNVETGGEIELASTNYFNDIVSVNGVIYYSPAVYQINGKVGLYKVNADGSGKKMLYDKEVWNMFRTAYDKFSLSVGQDWYELNLADDQIKKIGGAPSVLRSRVYINSPSQKQSIWVDERDGKSVLLSYGVESKTDRNLVTESGIKNPVYWLDDDHLVYRVSDSDETADYVMSLSGGVPKKIRDVTNTVGVDRWYYF